MFLFDKFFLEIWNILLLKATVATSDHYIILPPYKMIDQKQHKNMFIPSYAIRNAPMKGIIFMSAK